MSDAAVRVLRLDDLGHLNLRGDPQDEDIRTAVESVLGQPLPVEPNTMTEEDHRAFWLGPDEWLISSPVDAAALLLEKLNGALTSHHASINDVSGGNVALQVSGENVRNLIAKGCTLDLHPSVFKVGDCAQSGLAKAGVLLGLTDDAPVFDLVVRSSFSDYIVQWLRHAGREYGIEFH